MNILPASFMGTSAATVLGTAYAIFDEDKYILWTDLTRVMLMGGAALVLISYSVVWYLVERQDETQARKQEKPKLEYGIMMAGHLLLGLSLAFVGTDLSLYLKLFTAFIAVSFLWTWLVSKSRRSLFAHECINFLLCLVFVWVAFRLYGFAMDFEFSYSAMTLDPVSYDVFRTTRLGRMSDTNMVLGLVVGMVILNLMVLIAGRFSWPKSFLSWRSAQPGDRADGQGG